MTKPTGRPRHRPAKPLRPRQKVKAGRLSFTPIYEELLDHHLVTATQIGAFYGYDQRIVRDWARHGVGTYLADRLCVKLGVLPFIVYGDAFFDEALMAHEVSSRGGRRKAFTADDVRSIRARAAAGETAYAMAKEFGVAQPTVRNIVLGRAYGNVA